MNDESRPRPAIPVRLLLTALIALGIAAGFSAVLFVTDTALSIYERLADAPRLLAWTLGLALGGLAGAGIWLAWRIWRGPPRTPSANRTAAPGRDRIEARVAALEARAAGAEARAELIELDRRSAAGEVHVALFGEISAGKSSLMRALGGGDAAIDVRGGTTRTIAHARTQLPDGRELVLADMPGLAEPGAGALAAAARAETTRAHAVIYVCEGDLTRVQHAELTRLIALGKPLVLALNKTDRYRPEELRTLLNALQQRYGADALVLPVVAGGSETSLRRLPDGREERVERERAPRLAALLEGIGRITAAGFAALEPARQRAVLSELQTSIANDERELAASDAEACVARYTRRAVIGALAAVAPGTDLVIQGALASAMLRELTQLHGLGLKDLDLDAFVARAGSTVRTTTSITLAIAGNALKAFPGFGTLGGGLLHALAYGMIFDALGRAVATTLADRRALDVEAALTRFEGDLARPEPTRLLRLARETVALLGRDMSESNAKETKA
jgi:GTPase SAR1 family protein